MYRGAQTVMGRRLRVLSVANPFLPLGEQCLSGPEQLIRSINRALLGRGHESTVLACAGSSFKGAMVLFGRSTSDLTAVRSEIRLKIARLLWEQHYDLVHLHGLDFASYLPEEPVPVLVTLHWPLCWYPDGSFEFSRPATYLQRLYGVQKQIGSGKGRWLRPISGDVSSAIAAHRRGHYALFMAGDPGSTAMFARAVSRIGIPLVIIPQNREESAAATRVLTRHCHFLGPVNLLRRKRLLAGARCLLLADGPRSCLQALEALGCGTPVIGFRDSPLKDIVQHGCNGFLVSGEDQLEDAILECGPMAACMHPAGHRKFLRQMIQSHLEIYQFMVDTDHDGDF